MQLGTLQDFIDLCAEFGCPVEDPVKDRVYSGALPTPDTRSGYPAYSAGASLCIVSIMAEDYCNMSLARSTRMLNKARQLFCKVKVLTCGQVRIWISDNDRLCNRAVAKPSYPVGSRVLYKVRDNGKETEAYAYGIVECIICGDDGLQYAIDGSAWHDHASVIGELEPATEATVKWVIASLQENDEEEDCGE
jgi:hypothetical protein